MLGHNSPKCVVPLNRSSHTYQAPWQTRVALNIEQCLSRVLDSNRLDWVSQFEAEHPGIEVEFGIKCTLNVLRPPKAVLLTLKQDIRYWYSLPAEGAYHHLCLVGWDNPVLISLKIITGQYRRTTKLIGERSTYKSRRSGCNRSAV